MVKYKYTCLVTITGWAEDGADIERVEKEFENDSPLVIRSVLKQGLEDVIDVWVDYQYGVAYEVDEE